MNAGQAYRESSAVGASPVRLVVLLYEQIVFDLRRAMTAIESGDVEARTRHINHSILVLAHLQATLDYERGGDVARNLQALYEVSRQRLAAAQCLASEAVLEEQARIFADLCAAWQQVQQANERGMAGTGMRASGRLQETSTSQ